MSVSVGDAAASGWLSRWKLFHWLALLILVPVFLLAGAALINARQEYRNAERDALAQASTIAREAALRLDEYYDELEQFLTAVAEVARPALQHGADGDPPLLRMIHATPQHVTGISILSLDGRMLASTTAAPETRAQVNVADRRYFRQALATRRVVVDEPVFARTANRWVSIAGRAVYDDADRAIGAVSTSADLERMHAILVPMGLPLGALMTVFNERGAGIASNAEPRAVMGRDLAQTPAIQRVLVTRELNGKTVASDGQTRLLAYAGGEKLPWLIEVGLDVGQTLAPARQALRERLSMLALALVLGLAAAALLARWIGRPIHELERDAEGLGSDGFARRTRAHGYAEVNRLAAAFNGMAHANQTKQRELADSEARFRALVMLSSDWYWTQDAQYRFTSHTAGRFGEIGFNADDFHGKTRWDMPGAEPVDTTWEVHRALLNARKPWRDLIVRYADRQGEMQYISSSGEPVFDENGVFTGYRGVARLVTERYRLEAAVRESEERLRATLDYSPNVAVQWYDRDGRVRFWNRASTAVYGWRDDEAVGCTLVELGLYTPAQFDEFVAALSEVDRAGPRVTPAESAFRRKDGSEGMILSTLFAIPSATGGFVWISTSPSAYGWKRSYGNG